MLAQQYGGPLHLAVSPLVLPKIGGGRDSASRGLSKHPGMKALFVSGYDGDSVRRHRIHPRFHLQQPG